MTIIKKIHTITSADDDVREVEIDVTPKMIACAIFGREEFNSKTEKEREAIIDTIWELGNNCFLDEEEIKKVLED